MPHKAQLPSNRPQPRVSLDPLARALQRAARRTTDPALKAWTRSLLHGEEAHGRAHGHRDLLDQTARAAAPSAPADSG